MPSSKKSSTTKAQKAAKKAARMTKFTTRTCRQVHKGSIKTAIAAGFAHQKRTCWGRGKAGSVLMEAAPGLMARAFT